MPQIPGRKVVVQRFYASAGSLLSVGFTSAPVLLLLTTCWVHAQSGPTSNSTRKNKAATSDVSPISPQEVVPTPVAPESALSVEKKPPLARSCLGWQETHHRCRQRHIGGYSRRSAAPDWCIHRHTSGSFRGESVRSSRTWAATRCHFHSVVRHAV